MRRRRVAFARELDRNDVPYALVYGANRSGSAVSWLTGWPVTLAAPGFTLATGMTVVVQPNVTTPDGRAGVQTGELLLVTEHGPQRLHTYPKGLRRAG